MSLHAAPRKAKPCAFSYPHDGHKWICPPYGRQAFSWEWCPGRTTAIGDEDFASPTRRRLAWVSVVAVGLVVLLSVGYLFGG